MEGGHTQHDQPFRLLHAIRIRLGISQALPFCVFSILNFTFRAVADKDGLASPFYNDL